MVKPSLISGKMELLNPNPETKQRLDVMADQQQVDLREFLEKNKDAKAYIILDINERKVSVEFKLGQVQELAEKFNIDIFPMMINQLLREHVQGSKEAETISEKPTTI